MKDTQLYEQILGIEAPWRVDGVTLKREAQEIEVEVGLDRDRPWACPTCRLAMHIHGYERRRWRHLDSCQYKTIVTAEVPRVSCSEHGTQAVQVPWAERYSRFTRLFERLAIDVLQECSTSAAREILRISWEEADGIKQRAIDRGLGRRKLDGLKRLCIDEKAVGHGHDYVTIVSRADGPRATVLAVEDGREQDSLDRFWHRLSEEQRAGVETVAMDMWEAYWNSTVLHVPGATGKIVYDNFHMAKHMNFAVDEVRRQEHMLGRGDAAEALKGTRSMWLYGKENLPGRWARRFREVMAVATQTARAWKVKELLRSFWRCVDMEDAREFFRKWYRQAIGSRLEPVKKVARLFKRHLANILTYFRHHLSNAASEGLNSRIQHLIQQACGYRNRERFKRDVLFHLGGLDLYPEFVQ